MECVKKKIFILIPICFISMFCMYIPFINLYAKNLTRVLLPCSAIIVAIVKAKELKREILRKDVIVYLAFCTCYVVTIVVNYKYNFVQNCKALIWLIIYALVFYLWHENTIYEYAKKIIITNRIIIICNFLCLVIGIVLLIFDKPLPDYYGQPLGMSEGRLFGIYLEVNSGCIITVCTMMMSYLNYNIEKLIGDNNGRWKIFYIINVIFGYLFCVAVKANTAQICICVSCAIIMCSHIYRYIVAKGIICKLGIYLIVCIISLSGIYGGIKGTERCIEEVISQRRSEKANIMGGTFARFERDNEELSVHVRFTIWEESMQLWKEYKPLIGIGQANMKVYAEMSPNTESYQHLKSNKYGEAAHNAYISILLSAGLVGMICIGMLLAMILGKSVMLFFKNAKLKNQYIRNIFISQVCIVVSLLLYGIMFNAIAFNNVMETVLFWWYLGLLCRMIQNLKQKQTLLEGKCI